MQSPTDREACAALVYALYLALDTHDYLGLEGLFTPQARMTRLGETHAGLPAIASAFARRPATLRTRHLVCNLLIEDAADGALGRFTMTVVRGQAPPGAELPLLVRGPWRVSDVRVRFEQEPAGWRIAALATESQFEFDPALGTTEAST